MPDVVPLIILDDPRAALFEGLRQPVLPDPGMLDQVIVD